MTRPTAVPAAPPYGKAAPLPQELQRKIDDAITATRLPEGDAMVEAGITQLSYRIHPSVTPTHVVDFFFRQRGERSRSMVGEWVWSEAVKFTQANGIFLGVTHGGKQHFLDEIEPRLHAKGAGIEDWAKHLDASGLFKEVPGK